MIRNSCPQTELELEDALTEPDAALVEVMSRVEGDILVLGAGGKMGPTLCILARRAMEMAGGRGRVIAVSRFGDTSAQERLRSSGVETISADLLDGGALRSLPDCRSVIYLAGMKFGSTGNSGLTWAMNVLLPAMVAERYRHSRIVALSTGNVYPFMTPESGGATEETPPAPTGEYAWSALGRERMFQFAGERWGTQSVIVRLNYANDLRYGVLQDVARKVQAGEPVDVSMGWLNTIWQGDANSIILRSLEAAGAPPFVLNLTGPDTVSVRDLAIRFGELLGRDPIILGDESPTALVSNAGRCFELFGTPSTPLEKMIDWTAAWVRQGGRSLGKPTHFETRDGKF